MNEELQNKLKVNYPAVYGSVGKNSPISYWGIECGDGWYDILDMLGILLTRAIDEYKLTDSFKLMQVKEKFGALRFYYSERTDNAYIYGLVMMAEGIAERTCERCGDKGTRHNNGWLITLCNKHYKEWENVNGRSLRTAPKGEAKALKKKTQKRSVKTKRKEKA